MLALENLIFCLRLKVGKHEIIELEYFEFAENDQELFTRQAESRSVHSRASHTNRIIECVT